MIGEKIKNSRKKMGLTQEELVKKAYNHCERQLADGIISEIKVFDQAQLSKWENGEQMPNTNNLLLLSILLNTSFFELTSEDDKKITDAFYNGGYNLAQNIKSDLKTTIHTLLEYVKNSKIHEINQKIIELYVYNNLSIPEDIAIMIPTTYIDIENGLEKYMSYIQVFISGLNNGNLNKQENEEKD